MRWLTWERGGEKTNYSKSLAGAASHREKIARGKKKGVFQPQRVPLRETKKERDRTLPATQKNPVPNIEDAPADTEKISAGPKGERGKTSPLKGEGEGKGGSADANVEASGGIIGAEGKRRTKRP